MRLDLSHSHTRHAVNQVKQYIEDVAKKEMHDRDRLLGVVWDARSWSSSAIVLDGVDLWRAWTTGVLAGRDSSVTSC